jgi:hypothetical protein
MSIYESKMKMCWYWKKCLCVVWLGLCSGGASAVLISLSPPTSTVGLGDKVNIAVKIAGLGNISAPSVGSFDIDIGFDSNILAFNQALFGGGLDVLGLGSQQQITPALGSVNFFELSFDLPSELDSLQADDFTLITLKFDALKVGQSNLTILVNSLGDSVGEGLMAESLGAQIIVESNGTAPEPSTLLTLLLGFAFLHNSRRVRESA